MSAGAGTEISETAWKSIDEEALECLRALLRFDTTNPPGGEAPACAYLAGILEKEGIPFEIFESAPGRANLVSRLKGSGAARPLLLSAHLDVVGVERERWSHDPFGGELDEGCLWGRGALDMKHMAAMSLATLLLLRRQGVSLARDVIFAAVADEETGGRYGSAWLVEHHPEQVEAEYCLGEIGGFSRIVGGKHFYPVQTAEKGICWIRIRATGEPGHGSLPNWDGAVAKIGRAAERLGSRRLPFHRTEQAAVFLETMARHQSFPNRQVLRKILDPRFSRILLERVFPDKSLARSLYAVLHNTANPTVLRAGEKINVLPSEAVLEVDGRTLPGQTAEDFVREVRAVIGDDYQIEIVFQMPAVAAPLQDPILARMSEALRLHDPLAIVVPYMAPGFTDAKHYSRLGIRCFGFSPVKLPARFPFIELMHGHDERIPVEGFRFGLRVLYDFVRRFCT
ncbi:MAG: M20/M25/M40 family metallo-hydrolase [bacterium]